MFDVREYEKIVMQYSKPLYRYCYLKLGYSKELTEETLNDVFRILYEKWDRIEKGDGIRAYLYRVSDMCIKSSLRKQNRYYSRNSSLEESLDRGDFDAVKHFDSYFEDGDIEKRINCIAEELPEEMKTLFLLRYAEKKTITEISDITAIPYSTLRLRFAKIEKTVRQKILNN